MDVCAGVIYAIEPISTYNAVARSIAGVVYFTFLWQREKRDIGWPVNRSLDAVLFHSPM